jgi:glycerophosphoryl diester phosphodiesterase
MLEKNLYGESAVDPFRPKLATNARSLTTIVCGFVLLCATSSIAQIASAPSAAKDPYLTLMTRAAAHAKQHGDRAVPVFSPEKGTLLGPAASVNVKAIQAAGVTVVPWTVNDLPTMRQLLDLHVDGIISDRSDLLVTALKEAREKAAGDTAQLAYLDHLDLVGHRGSRGLRPENTLPAFEAGLDTGVIVSFETDTGVTTDHRALIWHDQFLNPQSCRRVDGQPYTIENRVYTHDISLAYAQKQFICDKLYFGQEQKNDLALSPVAVAFAALEQMISPYTPTYLDQLFRFVEFYARWYRSGPGKSSPDSVVRVRTAERVHFVIETKLLPPGYSVAKMESMALGKTEAELQAAGRLSPADVTPNKTVSAEEFVKTICGVVQAYHMDERSSIESFDFRTLLLVQEKYTAMRTNYLTATPRLLNSDFTPESLRTPIASDRKP